jgi:hypothetical protein
MTSHASAQPAVAKDKTRRTGRLVARSVTRFPRLLLSGALHHRHDHLGISYAIDQGGQYQAFRETVSDDGTREANAVLVVGFRLRGLGNRRALHALFRRVCLLTTPFWSGFKGFRVKLWMVDPVNDNYLGIYEWSGAANAQTYATALARILRPISTQGSVWYHIYPDRALEPFLREHEHQTRVNVMREEMTVKGT